jgi:hypothetical protein
MHSISRKKKASANTSRGSLFEEKKQAHRQRKNEEISMLNLRARLASFNSFGRNKIKNIDDII